MVSNSKLPPGAPRETSCTFLIKQDKQQFHNNSGTETTPDCCSNIATRLPAIEQELKVWRGRIGHSG